MAKKRTKLSDSKEPAVLEKLRGYLSIDKHALDDEIVNQPNLFFEISEAYVQSAARRDYLKEEIKRVDAELHGVHRRAIEKGGNRATDSAVAAAVANDKRHHKAVDDHISASQECDLLQALKEAFHQRSYMLRDLASLHIANYYEKNAINGDSGNVREVRAQSNINRMAEKRKHGSRNSMRSRSKD